MGAILVAAALLQAAPSTVVTVARGTSSAIEDRRETVARTADEWSRLWMSHAGSQPSATVDLTKSMVAAVFIGTRPTGGYSVEIRGTRRDADTLVIEYAVRAPTRGDIVTQVITSPFHIVALPRHDGPVRFEQQDGAPR